MIYVVCNGTDGTTFQRLFSYIDSESVPVIVSDLVKLQSIFSSPKTNARLVVIEASLMWDDGLAQDFFGFDVATILRRDYSLKCPIIISSPLRQTFFEQSAQANPKFELLNAK